MHALPTFNIGICADLCNSFLALAKTDGWGDSLVHGKKTQWFDGRNTMFFAPGVVLCRYKVCNAINVRRKFKEAELHARSLFESRSHQNDDTGEDNEGNMPSYVNLLFDIFKFVKEHASGLASARASRWRNIRVSRSVIGQQVALSDFDNPTLNTTVTPLGRDIRSGEVAGEIVINEISPIE